MGGQNLLTEGLHCRVMGQLASLFTRSPNEESGVFPLETSIFI